MQALVLLIAQQDMLFLLLKLFASSILAGLTVRAAIASSKNVLFAPPLLISIQAHVSQPALLLLLSRQVSAKTILRA